MMACISYSEKKDKIQLKSLDKKAFFDYHCVCTPHKIGGPNAGRNIQTRTQLRSIPSR